MIRLDTKLSLNRDLVQAPNLVERFGAEDLQRIGGLVWDGYRHDLSSRSKWERRMNTSMDLAMQIQKDKSFPWPNCANVVFPLLTIAALQFSARSYANIIQGTDVVRYRVSSGVSSQLQEAADRIGRHMSWQVLEEDQAWEEQHDRLLINLAIVGTSFIKSYFSAAEGHNVSELVMARDLVVNYWAKSVESAPRKTHVIPLFRNDLYERVENGTYADVRDEAWFSSTPQHLEGTPRHDVRTGEMPPEPDEDTPFRMLEQHRLLDLDGDGYAEPYIVTIEEGSKAVLRLVARFGDEAAVERNAAGRVRMVHAEEYFTKYGFIPAPDGGLYDLGFGTLIGPLNESVNAAINQMIDSGTMYNANGGFLGRGAKIRGGAYNIAPFSWVRVDSTGDDLKKSMIPFEVREPSSVMFDLLGLLIQYTDRIAGTVEQMVGENPGQNTKAQTSANTLEQGMQVYSSIFKRVWRSMKEEFKKLHRLNAAYLPQSSQFGAEGKEVRREDYRTNPNLVAPVADPNLTSQSMRVGIAQTLREAAHSVPGYDIQEVEKNFLRAVRVDSIERFYPGPDKVPPLPNPKLQIEQTKMQVKMQELQLKNQHFMLDLQEQKKLNNATITKLEADAVKVVNEIGEGRAAHQLEAFNSAIAAMKAHNEVIDSRIDTLLKLGGGDESGRGADGGGISGMARGSSNGSGEGATA